MRSPIPRYTFLAFELNHMLDRGLHLDPEETNARIADGTFFDWAGEQFGDSDDFDVSIYDAEERSVVLRALEHVAESTDARRKFGVQWNGISLALAYCIQVIQGWDSGEYERLD